MEAKTFQLNEIFQFLQKSRRKAGDGLDTGHYPFFTSSQLQTKWFDEADYSSEAIILGTGGAPSVHCSNNFSASADTFVITPKNRNVLAKYVYYFLIGNRNILDRGFKGAGLKHLSREYTEKIQIPFPVNEYGDPALAEQKRIVATLEEAETLKKKRAEADQKMNELIPALFIQMFGDPSTNPMGWETGKAERFLKIQPGFAFKSKDFVRFGAPLIKIGTINKGYFDRNVLCFLPKSYLSIYQQFIINPGDLLITLTGTAGKDDYGNVFLLGNEYECYLLNQRVAKLKVSSAEINKLYFHYFLKDKKVKNSIIKNNRGVRQGNLSNSDLLNLRVLLPPIDLQNKFAEKVKEIEAQKEKQKQSAIQLDVLFSSLLSRSFSMSYQQPDVRETSKQSAI